MPGQKTQTPSPHLPLLNFIQSPRSYGDIARHTPSRATGASGRPRDNTPGTGTGNTHTAVPTQAGTEPARHYGDETPEAVIL